MIFPDCLSNQFRLCVYNTTYNLNINNYKIIMIITYSCIILYTLRLFVYRIHPQHISSRYVKLCTRRQNNKRPLIRLKIKNTFFFYIYIYLSLAFASQTRPNTLLYHYFVYEYRIIILLSPVPAFIYLHIITF